MLSIILFLLQIQPELNSILHFQNSEKADMWLLSHKHYYLLQTETHRPGDSAVAGQWVMACNSAGKSDWQKLGCLSAAAGVSLYIYLEGLRCLQSLYSVRRLCMFQLLEEEKQVIHHKTAKDISKPYLIVVKVLRQPQAVQNDDT